MVIVIYVLYNLYIYIYSKLIFKDCNICFELPMSFPFFILRLKIIMHLKIDTFYIISQIYWHYAFPLKTKGIL